MCRAWMGRGAGGWGLAQARVGSRYQSEQVRDRAVAGSHCSQLTPNPGDKLSPATLNAAQEHSLNVSSTVSYLRDELRLGGATALIQCQT